MSDTSRRESREPAERPFPYVPRAVPVTVEPEDVATVTYLTVAAHNEAVLRERGEWWPS